MVWNISLAIGSLLYLNTGPGGLGRGRGRKKRDLGSHFMFPLPGWVQTHARFCALVGNEGLNVEQCSTVIALGHYNLEPHRLMATPSLLWLAARRLPIL